MYSIRDGFHIKTSWRSCHCGNKRKILKIIWGWKKGFYEKMFSHKLYQKMASKGVHNKYIDLEKKTQFYLKDGFHKTLSRGSCQMGYTRNIWKNLKSEIIFLDERSFSHRYNLISHQWLSTGKFRNFSSLVIFSMNYRLHVILSWKLYQWG